MGCSPVRTIAVSKPAAQNYYHKREAFDVDENQLLAGNERL